eukprot:CAMPEP_0202706700 /NCGR_PEP_ID=MMETSP1385-20130828/19080_1 /ASSEMBLY_ACC=CAM_ASM_000861 /TAXON_ID=933848 /ORGANISM="Elphidium margaritaceum" /LENGTH=1102 /DNA_ID=CAMNT_0049365227 /DNA_START=89 /DNA_END=3394 /DNA_ORIENTATION=-
MSADDNLKRFVSNFLHETQGFSEDTSVEYLIDRAKNAHSVHDILNELKLYEIAHHKNAAQFAQSLFDGVPHLQQERQQKQKQKRKEFYHKVLAQEQQRSFPLISASFDSDSDSDGEGDKKVSKTKTKTKTGKKEHRQKTKYIHKRERDDGDGGDGNGDNGDAENSQQQQRKKRKLQSEADEEHLRTIADQQQRREFEARMKKKDLERQREKLSAEQKERLEAEAARKVLQKSGDRALFERARTMAERRYKNERVQQQLHLYRGRLRDEEQLFGNDDDEHLTKGERERRALQAQIYNMAHETVQNRDEETDAYHLPALYDRTGGTEQGLIDRKAREQVMKGRYKRRNAADDDDDAGGGGGNGADDGGGGGAHMDQQRWETSRLRDALGAQVSQSALNGHASAPIVDEWTKKAQREQHEYETLLDDEIEFITDALKQGNDLETKLKQEMAEADAHAQRSKEERQLSLQEFRKTLPVYKSRDDLLTHFGDYQVMVIVAATGSGKTTQIPQYVWEERARFLDDGQLMIGVTQPRRVAAMSVAMRVSREMDVRLGSTVGYSVRFEDKTSDDTRIKYLTDGMLLREFLIDPMLSKYGVIMIDEAHERTLHTDVLFGLLKDLCRARPEMKLLISSATLEASKFCDFFDNAPEYKIAGRSFPIDVYYLKAPEANYIEAVCISVLQLHCSQPLPGDMLVFLTGEEEIELCRQSLEQRTRALGRRIKELLILPIYANLPSEQQIRIFEPTPENARKVVLSTNIAETSLTIDGIVYVIDPGFAKQSNYSAQSGMDSLVVTPISRASAEQRAGRAGRTAPGKCFRLYTRDAFTNEMDEMTLPEIQRTNLANVVLLLKSLGINDLIHFDFMDAPPAQTLMRALELLYGLGALNNLGQLTTIGRRMAEFPIDPQLSKCLCESGKYGCTKQILTIASMLSANHQIFYAPKEQSTAADTLHRNFFKPAGDHYTLLNIYEQWSEDTDFSHNWCQQNFLQFRALNRARDVREQLENLCVRVELDPNVSAEDNDAEDGDGGTGLTATQRIGQALTAGYFFHSAKLSHNGQYKTIRFQTEVQMHPSSCLAKTEALPKWLLFHELVLTSAEYMRNVIEIEPVW